MFLSPSACDDRGAAPLVPYVSKRQKTLLTQSFCFVSFYAAESSTDLACLARTPCAHPALHFTCKANKTIWIHCIQSVSNTLCYIWRLLLAWLSPIWLSPSHLVRLFAWLSMSADCKVRKYQKTSCSPKRFECSRCISNEVSSNVWLVY